MQYNFCNCLHCCTGLTSHTQVEPKVDAFIRKEVKNANLQSEIFIPKWTVIIADHAGSLAL